jgi:pimeloyl-ACP methyl ester carboxylesterase
MDRLKAAGGNSCTTRLDGSLQKSRAFFKTSCSAAEVRRSLARPGHAILTAIAIFLTAMTIFACAIPAHSGAAQMSLVPDTAAHHLLGPTLAAGAVIWSHGRSPNSEDSSAPTPPYIEDFRRQRWDVYRFNRMRVSDTLEASSAVLARLADHLKVRGYREVVLAGQSFGAFISLMAADKSESVDAVIATAPAAFGAVNEAGAHYRLNASALYPILEQLRHGRVMLFYFHNDDFDPGGRGSYSEEILAENGIPHLIIDDPPQLATHYAATTQRFAATFASCIIGFVDGAPAAHPPCKATPTIPPPPSPVASALLMSPPVDRSPQLQGSSRPTRDGPGLP